MAGLVWAVTGSEVPPVSVHLLDTVGVVSAVTAGEGAALTHLLLFRRLALKPQEQS